MTARLLAALAATLLVNASQANPGENEEPRPLKWQAFELSKTSPAAEKREILQSRGIQRVSLPEPEPLVAELMPDGTLLIHHRPMGNKARKDQPDQPNGESPK